jgi:phosphate transport system protein
MNKHFQRDTEHLHHELLAVLVLVEEMIQEAAKALVEGQFGAVEAVVRMDETVDEREVQIEEECLKILALHQPVAVDLRRLATVLKVNNDLERIGDLAVNIAVRALVLEKYPDFEVPADVPRMVDLANGMVHSALDALLRMDGDEAHRIMGVDEEVDGLAHDVVEHLQQSMQASPNNVVPALNCFSAVHSVERIADHATNIAEDVVYLVGGEIIRHRHETGESSS